MCSSDLGLQQLGWIDGRNVRTDYRWAAGTVENFRKYAAELVALAPDVILAVGGSTGPVLQATRTVPIVFTVTSDPVGSGFVDSLSRPGRNATGFMLFEYSLSAKWVELLKQIAPGVTRAAVLRDPELTSGIGQFSVIQSVAACCTTTAAILQKVLHILPPIVVGDFLLWLDSP